MVDTGKIGPFSRVVPMQPSKKDDNNRKNKRMHKNDENKKNKNNDKDPGDTIIDEYV